MMRLKSNTAVRESNPREELLDQGLISIFHHCFSHKLLARSRKWREWKNNKEARVLPNAQNLHFYIN